MRLRNPVRRLDALEQFARKSAALLLSCLTLLLAASVASAPALGATSLKKLIAAAQAEGKLELYASSTLTPKGADTLASAFNKMFGTHIAVRYTGAGSMIRDSARAITEISLGGKPTWDIMLVTDAHYATLVRNKAIDTYDYAGKLGLDPKLLFYGGHVVAFATQFIAPAYNTKLVSAADAPKTWDDILNPKWKGKMGVSTAVHHWARLAQVWGVKKTDAFVHKLAAMKPKLGRVGTIFTQLQLGGISVAASMADSFVNKAKRTGAPVAFIPDADPIIAGQYMAAGLKNAAHPNAARLWAYFLSTPEAQKIWHKFQGQSCMFVRGTPAYEFAQHHHVLVASSDFALKHLSKLTKKYGHMLGLR